MLYEDPTKDVSSDERFHVELHFSPGVNCCVQKELPPGPGFRPHSRKENVLEDSSTAAASIGVAPPPPPPLVCSIKCSEKDVGKIFKSQTSMPYEDVFDLNDHDQLVNPCNVHAAPLDDVIEELSENEDEDAKTKKDTTSEPIEIKSSRKEQNEDDKVMFKLLVCTNIAVIQRV